MKLKNKIRHALIIAASMLLLACGSDHTPKPRAYYRIALPEKAYQRFENRNFPFSFEYPEYTNIELKTGKDEKYWMDIVYPSLNGRVHLSYLTAKNDSVLSKYITDANKLVGFHQQKATGIREKAYEYPEKQVYGMVFDIRGSGVASTYQFYLTDQKKQFLRGALYFEVVPNNDSLAPVIQFVKEDIDKMIMSFEWN